MSLGPGDVWWHGYQFHGQQSCRCRACTQKQQRIDNERAQIDTSISAYGRLRESLDTTKKYDGELFVGKALLCAKSTRLDDSIVSATATTGMRLPVNMPSMCCSLPEP